MGLSPTPGLSSRQAGDVPPPSYVGPLDLVAGAVVAYGVRALSAAWLGQNIFRLRRDSDDAESDFAADAVTGEAPVASIATWKDAAGAADAFLVTWYDQNGGGFHVTQATTSKQPQYIANAANGHPCFDFVLADDQVLKSAGSAVFNTGNYFGFCVLKDTNAVGVLHVFGGGDAGADFEWRVSINTGLNVVLDTYDDGTEIGGSSEAYARPAGDSYLVDGSWGDGSWAAAVNGSALTQDSSFGTGATTITQPVSVGGVPSSGGVYSGRLFEIVAGKIIPSGAEKTAVRSNIADYYGITLS